MKRKKTEEAPAKFWPVPGVDGEPYPPLVQEALDLVEKETLRRKRAECKHLNRRFQAAGRSDHGYGPFRYDRVCEDCGKRLSCEHPDNGLRRKRVEFIRNVSFLEFWECNCGEMIARRVPEPTRQTGTDWLKTAEEERQTERRMSRHMKRTAEHAISDPDSPYAVLPLMASLRRDIQEIREEAERLKPYAPGALRTSADAGDVFVLRNAKGEAVIMTPKEDDWYSHESDMSWIRTNGRMQL